MDSAYSISTGLAGSSVAEGVSIGMLSSVQNLDKIVSAKLFQSIGIGAGIDTYA